MHDIKQVYEQYSNTVYKYLLYLSNKEDVAEDLTQETFAIAVKEINKFKGDCKISVWLCQIAKHLWYKELKKAKPNLNLEEIENETEDLVNVEDIILDKEDKLNFFKNIQKLDEKSRDIIYLRMVGNLDFNEIGEIIGKTPNWARVKFYRAKQKIKEVYINEKGNRM